MKYPLMRNNFSRQDLDAVIELLKQDDPFLTNGAQVRAFEAEWSSWLGVGYSVFVNSGSSANLLSMTVLKLKYPEGGEVIVPPLTWVSDIAAVIQCGFTPVFADICPRTLGMDTKEILSKLTPNTRAVFYTYAQGFNGLTDELIRTLKEKDIHLIEDVCESHGATHQGKKLGSFGCMSNFSFYYAHHMSTIEGGMVCTNDPMVYQQLRLLRSHGMVRELTDVNLINQYKQNNPTLNPDFIFAFPAYNMRNTEIGGVLGRSQLKRLDTIVQKRTQNFLYFLKKIDSDIFFTDFEVDGSSNYAFNIILKEPNNHLAELLMNKMRETGIEFRRGSAGGGNQLRQPYLKSLVIEDHYKEFPNTDHIHFYGFYIANYPTISNQEIDEICAALNSIG